MPLNFKPRPLSHKPIRNGRLGVSCRLGLSLLATMTFSGCQTTGLSPLAWSAGYKPDNIFKRSNLLEANVKRIVVLPIVATDSRSGLAEARESLHPVLLAELMKTKRFEVLSASPKQLDQKTGRQVWSAADVLPSNFFEILRESYGCDAVLFAELTEYRAYAPLAVGWRFQLVDARTKYPIWAGDELFDARKPEVLAAVRRSAGATGSWAWQSEESGSDWVLLHSPKRFAEYAAAQMFDTLPTR